MHVSELQAVLFDMDGTLCDTEPAWLAAENAMARRYDAQWTPQDGLHLVGHSLLSAGAYIRDRMGLSLTPAQVVDELLDDVVATVARLGVEWRAGALELLRECNEAGVPTALVTMSYDRFARSVLDRMPPGPAFDVVVTGDRVERGKPAPDPYLKAAAELGVETTWSVAIEDSPSGAESAEAAGCLVVTVPNHVPIPLTANRRQRASLADVGVEHLRELVAQR